MTMTTTNPSSEGVVPHDEGQWNNAGIGWANSVDIIRPHTVQIFTPGGFGSGFMFYRSSVTGFIGIATAAHVLSHAPVAGANPDPSSTIGQGSFP